MRVLNDLAMGFFYQMQFIMLDDVVLASARLLDRDRRTLSLPFLVARLSKTKAHADVPALEARLKRLERLGAPLLAHRNKRIAHASIRHHPAIVGSVLPGITEDLIDRYLKSVAELMRAVATPFGAGAPVGEPVSQDGDGDTLVWNLFKAADYDSLIPDAHDRAVRLQGRGWRGSGRS